jgi:hypothetical protein
VALANAEALFLLGADHVLGQVAQQAPIEQLAFPWLHALLVWGAVDAQ